MLFTIDELAALESALYTELCKDCDQIVDWESVPENEIDRYNFGELGTYDLVDAGHIVNDERSRKYYDRYVKAKSDLFKRLVAEEERMTNC